MGLPTGELIPLWDYDNDVGDETITSGLTSIAAGGGATASLHRKKRDISAVSTPSSLRRDYGGRGEGAAFVGDRLAGLRFHGLKILSSLFIQLLSSYYTSPQVYINGFKAVTAAVI